MLARSPEPEVLTEQRKKHNKISTMEEDTYIQDCLISTSYLAGFFDIFILLHIWQNCVGFGDFLPMRTLCDAYNEEFESWTYLE